MKQPQLVPIFQAPPVQRRIGQTTSKAYDLGASPTSARPRQSIALRQLPLFLPPESRSGFKAFRLFRL